MPLFRPLENGLFHLVTRLMPKGIRSHIGMAETPHHLNANLRALSRSTHILREDLEGTPDLILEESNRRGKILVCMAWQRG